jgi:son of sevenless-like protein
MRPSLLQDGLMLINVDKYVKLGKIAADFRRYQEVCITTAGQPWVIADKLQPFNFHEIEAVQTYLRRALAERGSGSLDALYRKSREFL